jgi:hypothetical protein
MVRCLDKLAGLVDFGKSQFLENPRSKLNLFAVVQRLQFTQAG